LNDITLGKFFSKSEYISIREFHISWAEKLKSIDSEKPDFQMYFILAQFWQVIFAWFSEYLENQSE
jgi:hypothetical protein